MLAWLVLPLLLFWFSIGYLVGQDQKPTWVTEKAPTAYNLSSSGETTAQPDFEWQGSGLVTFWFDDAWLTQFTVAYPLLAKYQIPGALSVATQMVGLEKYMSWAQIKRLQAEGWEIVSHSHSHNCSPEMLTEAKIEDELLGSKKELEANGLLVESFVTPCGIEAPLLEASAQKYYLSLRTSGPGLNSLPISEPYRLKVRVLHPDTQLAEVVAWLEEARDQRAWLILVFHQVDLGGEEFSATPVLLKEIINKIQESGLPVVLPRQALKLSIN